MNTTETILNKSVRDFTGGEVEVWYLLDRPTSAWIAAINQWASAPRNEAVAEIVSTLVSAFTELPLDHDATLAGPDPLYFT